MSLTHEYAITTPQPKDIRAITELWRASWLDTYPNEREGVTQDWVDEYTRAWLSDGELAERERQLGARLLAPTVKSTEIARNSRGLIVGSLFGSKEASQQELQTLYVAEDFRGRGVAADLMERFLEWTDPELPIKLQVARYSARAIRFYQKYGFKEVEHSAILFRNRIPCIAMVKNEMRSE